MAKAKHRKLMTMARTACAVAGLLRLAGGCHKARIQANPPLPLFDENPTLLHQRGFDPAGLTADQRRAQVYKCNLFHALSGHALAEQLAVLRTEARRFIKTSLRGNGHLFTPGHMRALVRAARCVRHSSPLVWLNSPRPEHKTEKQVAHRFSPPPGGGGTSPRRKNALQPVFIKVEKH